MGRGAGGGQGLLAMLKGRGPLEGTMRPRRDRRELGWMDRQEQPGESPSCPGQGAEDTESLGVSQSARGTLGPEWRGLQARREIGGAEKCGCKGGELTDPGKAHALGRPLSLALPFL